MRLSWNEVRARAAAFAEDWKDAAYEKGETQSFYNAFFDVFGVRRRNVARYEAHVAKLDNRSGFIDLFWPGVLLVEQKSAGRDLKAAYKQAGEYFDALPERERPRYILVSDFQTFEVHDLDEREVAAFALADLPAHVEAFGFILGVQRRTFRDQDPANIEAAELVGRLHDALADAGHRGHDLERFLVRVVFGMFADDTGVFEPRDIFLDFIETRTGEDGADLGPWLAQLFEVLDTPEDRRAATLDEDLARFPYVNGDLFEEHLRMFSFDAAMRGALLDACRFDWSNISPAIFGALFQSVMDPAERRAQGAHYTTEKNILKVIDPLFMDDLRAEFERVRARRGRGRLAALRQFQAKLGGMTFFDPRVRLWQLPHHRLPGTAPAGNRGHPGDPGRDRRDDAGSARCRVAVGGGRGPVLRDRAWRVPGPHRGDRAVDDGPHHEQPAEPGVRPDLRSHPAGEVAPHRARRRAGSGLVRTAAAGRLLVRAGQSAFRGAKYQTADQRSQVRGIVGLGKSGGTLDYVAAWFIKAGEYVKGCRVRIGFVATNSITQGEQVAQLWPVLFGRCKLEIAFAHRTFAWGSDARGKAHVHVVILGLDRRKAARAEKRLFSYPDINGDPEESRHAALSPYLFDAGGLSDPHLVVREESAPINGTGRLITGTQPLEDGNLTFSSEEKASFLEHEPSAGPYFRPFPGAREFIRGDVRWILHTAEIPPQKLRSLPMVVERLKAVREFRAKSKRQTTRRLADYPSAYGVTVVPGYPFLIVPQTSSERRDYVPIGYREPPVIPSEKLRLLPNATYTDFALLTSAMHMAWMRAVTGRMKSDYMYSVGVVYNTFPMPPKGADLSRLEPLAQAVLDARAAHSGATLADLYDPDLMPTNLRRAHQELDRAVDRLYRRTGFASERERVKHLFTLYETMRTPLEIAARGRTKRRRVPRPRGAA